MEILERPMQREEIMRIQKKADNIARLKQIELVRNANSVAGRNYQEGETTFLTVRDKLGFQKLFGIKKIRIDTESLSILWL